MPHHLLHHQRRLTRTRPPPLPLQHQFPNQITPSLPLLKRNSLNDHHYLYAQILIINNQTDRCRYSLINYSHWECSCILKAICGRSYIFFCLLVLKIVLLYYFCLVISLRRCYPIVSVFPWKMMLFFDR